MSVSEVLDHLRREYQGMPPVAAMRIEVAGYEDGALQLRAPLAANVNDKGTAFGGSLASLMTLAGWGLATLQLQLAGAKADVYVADSHIRYLAPLRSDLLADARIATDESWETFLATFRQRGRARIRLQARVMLPDGGVAATLEGRFVAIANG